MSAARRTTPGDRCRVAPASLRRTSGDEEWFDEPHQRTRDCFERMIVRTKRVVKRARQRFGALSSVSPEPVGTQGLQTHCVWSEPDVVIRVDSDAGYSFAATSLESVDVRVIRVEGAVEVLDDALDGEASVDHDA